MLVLLYVSFLYVCCFAASAAAAAAAAEISFGFPKQRQGSNRARSRPQVDHMDGVLAH